MNNREVLVANAVSELVGKTASGELAWVRFNANTFTLERSAGQLSIQKIESGPKTALMRLMDPVEHALSVRFVLNVADESGVERFSLRSEEGQPSHDQLSKLYEIIQDQEAKQGVGVIMDILRGP